MTETTGAHIGELVDTEAMLAKLAEYWARPWPGWDGRIPSRIAGSDLDQAIPDGVDNPFWRIIREVPLDGWDREPEAHFYRIAGTMPPRLLVDRDDLAGTYSWAICTPGDVGWMRDRLDGRKVVEVGAGTGYWAWQLAQAGVDVAAYDPQTPAENYQVAGAEPWHPVGLRDHTAAADHPDRALFVCWPGYGLPWAGLALAHYRGDQLFYAGEGWGGMCADDGFFQLLADQWEEAGGSPAHITYSGIHCRLTEYWRK